MPGLFIKDLGKPEEEIAIGGNDLIGSFEHDVGKYKVIVYAVPEIVSA